eukprot:TRINITY_DN19891_c1_g1_i4.p1 TRINITY_DN19891_c1_g1~~TRINITY_DN19891_c1_g1_i4.p1  ORF type:complete len:412 (-),score=81.32 TRINITY_DN19891_c1_g1_i4:358-1521(-)
MTTACTSAQIEHMCKARPLGAAGGRSKQVTQPVFEAEVKKEPSAPQLDTSDTPELLLSAGSKSHFLQRSSIAATWRQSKNRLRNVAWTTADMQSEEHGEEGESDGDEKEAVEPKEAANWTCSQCTFLNNGLLPACELCEAPAEWAAVQTDKVVAQPPPEDRESACAWPSLAQAGVQQRKEQEWETISTVSWLEGQQHWTMRPCRGDVTALPRMGKNRRPLLALLRSLLFCVCCWFFFALLFFVLGQKISQQKMAFVHVGGEALPKRDVVASDGDDAESVCSFLVLGDDGAAAEQEAEVGTLSETAGGSTTGALSWAARAAMGAKAPTVPSSKKPSSLPAAAGWQKARKPKMETVDENDEDEEACMWGCRGYVHRGRQWQKHPRRCAV